MTNQTIEQAVEEIVNKASDCAYGMNLDISGKESKRMMDEFSRSTWFKGELAQTLQAQRDAGAREALEWVISLEDEMHSTLTIEMTNQTDVDKGYILYQDMVLNIIKLAQEKLQALTPPTK